MQDPNRHHGLDALRAAMMLLGIVLHAAASYTVTYLDQAWPYQDAQRNGVFDWLLFIVHLFRMPTFFVMAGFFAAFLFTRDGPRGFLAHRARRLLLPLAVAWVLIFPLTISGFVYARAGGGAAGLAPALTYLGTTPYASPSLIHLWFVYDLLILSVAAWAVAPMVGRLPVGVRTGLVTAFGRAAPTLPGCLALGVLSGLTMMPMEGQGLDTSFAFLPPVRVLVAYGVFYTFGWLLFLRRDLIDSFGRRPWTYLAAGGAMSTVFMVIMIRALFADPLARHVAAVAAAGLAMWLLIYGVIGIFVRYGGAPRPIQRYLADASYWMYLIHLPLVIWMVGALEPLAWPALVKFAIVGGGVTLVTVATYHFFVRATIIGAVLNGRRFGRNLPQEAPLVSNA